MSKPKWTPGQQHERRLHERKVTTREIIAEIIANDKAAAANARLTAAAPTLYAALEALLDRYRADAGEDDWATNPVAIEARKVLRDARVE